ncbi:MAG: hypothetical protein M3N32_07775 [Actinomycetota bacterium]|nr:hypothetical protein [Actinomycetota bacterium]
MAWYWVIEAQLDPVDSTLWVDISSWVTAIALTRGRADDLETVEVSQLTVELENDDGRFTPENALGAYYPRVTLNRGVRAIVDISGTRYTRFTGHAVGWYPRWNGSDIGRVRLEANDAFERLSSFQLDDYATPNVIRSMNPDGYWPLGQTGQLSDLSANNVPAEVAGVYKKGADWIQYSRLTDAGLPQYFGPSLGVGDQGEGPGTSSGAAGAAYVADSPDYGVKDGSFSLHFRLWADMDNPDRNIIGIGRANPGATASSNRFTFARWAMYVNGFGDLAYHVGNGDGTSSGWAFSNMAPNPDLGYSIVAVITPTRNRFWMNGSLMIDGTDDKTPRLRNQGNLWMGAFEPTHTNDQYDTKGYGGRISDVAIWGRDASTIFGFSDLLASWRGWEGDTPGNRMRRLLDLSGWPTTERTLKAGRTVLAPMHKGGNLADVLRDLGRDDMGLVYVDAAGKIIFEDRIDRWFNRAAIVATFGDGAGETPYSTAGFSYDYVDLQNAVSVKSPTTGDVSWVPAGAYMEDAASVDEHGRRDISLEVDTLDAEELVDRASFELEAHKGIKLRMPDLNLGEVDGDARATTVTSLTLNALVRQYLRPAASSVIERRRRVQQIADRVGAGGYAWAVTLVVSDAEVDADVKPYGQAVVGTNRWSF